MIQIRRAVAPDAAFLARLGAETFTETFGHLYRAEDLEAFLDSNHSEEVYSRLLAEPAAAAWIAARDGAEIGYCVAGPCTLPVPAMPARAGEIARLYVRAGAQGDGAGRAMLETALAWLEERHDPVYLSVYAENFGAQRLYARYGFRKILEYEYMVGAHADPEWLMERRSG